MESYDEFYLPTGYEPNGYDLKKTYVESYTESLTQPQFSEQRFLEDLDYDDTALEGMSEKACLSVSRRRPCPNERRDPLWREQGDLLWQVVRS